MNELGILIMLLVVLAFGGACAHEVSHVIFDYDHTNHMGVE